MKSPPHSVHHHFIILYTSTTKDGYVVRIVINEARILLLVPVAKSAVERHRDKNSAAAWPGKARPSQI